MATTPTRWYTGRFEFPNQTEAEHFIDNVITTRYPGIGTYCWWGPSEDKVNVHFLYKDCPNTNAFAVLWAILLSCVSCQPNQITKKMEPTRVWSLPGLVRYLRMKYPNMTMNLYKDQDLTDEIMDAEVAKNLYKRKLAARMEEPTLPPKKRRAPRKAKKVEEKEVEIIDAPPSGDSPQDHVDGLSLTSPLAKKLKIAGVALKTIKKVLT